jgi:hypothetical protein
MYENNLGRNPDGRLENFRCYLRIITSKLNPFGHVSSRRPHQRRPHQSSKLDHVGPVDARGLHQPVMLNPFGPVDFRPSHQQVDSNYRITNLLVTRV